MAQNPVMLEIRIADRICYAQPVGECNLHREDGHVVLTAVEQGAAAVASTENPLLPPPPSPGAPDGHDETNPGTDPGVLERVHTGDRDPEAEELSAAERRAAARKAAAEGVDGPTGTPADAALNLSADTVADLATDTQVSVDPEANPS